MAARLLDWYHSLSISARTAWSLAAGFTLVIVCAALIAFNDEHANAIDESLARLDQRNDKIVEELGKRFDRIATTQTRAIDLFRAERAMLTPAEARREFEALYPLQPDGTRRSRDAMFDGGRTAIGYTQGMAAFIPAGIARDDEAVRDVVAATHAIRALGEGSRFEIESLYFFTPANGIVIFAPARPDRLEYYRKTAPAGFAFQDREFATISTTTANPARQMMCTGLQSLISLKDREIWTTGCMTPVDREGRHIGTFGTSMPLDQVVPAGHFSGPANDEVILVSREGRLIYHPEYTRQHSRETGTYLDITTSTKPELAALWALVRKHGSAGFTGKADGLGAYVSLQDVPGAGWYALTVKPERLILAEALRPIPRIAAIAVIALIVCILAVTFVLRSLVGKPLRDLTYDAQRITRELANDAILALPEREKGGNEVTRLVRWFETMASAIRQSHALLEDRVAERTSALNAANAKLKMLSEIDPLTGIANRRKILADLDTRLPRLRPGSAMAVLVIDIDNFKAINDRYGHVAGDDALRVLTERMQGLLRAGDALGRMGGEEFLIILDRARPAIADTIAERIRAAIARQTFAVHGNLELQITVSIGVANWHAGDDAKALYARADNALYQAKTLGRNCVVTSRYTPGIDRSAA
ncbi:sensor domain-containing diguanylate cyclase [Blastomonas aquatica]|uniref:diguanylate cyclase n=1 Tax=Blastomonas aquatica TaxID=1510276 RepID=A0ABQ1JBK8_9SPHN|nr:diguanylate cyclase [Blastomonas aquatica]GGB62396.1 GGDEF domain-containing protein [Blastomonas aquatica]